MKQLLHRLGALALLGFVVSYCGGSGGAAHAQAAKALNVAPLIGKDFAVYEKTLGKPALVEKNDDFASASADPALRPGETRYYRFPGLVRVILKRESDGVAELSGTAWQWKRQPTRLLAYVSYVEFQFPKKASTKWRDALKRVGLDPKAATDVFVYADGASAGMNYKGSRIQWAPHTVQGTNDHRLWIEVHQAQTPEKKAAAAWPPKLPPLSGKGLADFEALLGEPVFIATRRRIGPNGATQYERIYSNDGFGDGPKVILRVEGTQNPIIRAIDFQFPRRQFATWQAAMQAAGFSPVGVRAVRTEEGYTALSGVAGLHPDGNLWKPYGKGPVRTEAAVELPPPYDVLTVYVPAPVVAKTAGD